MLVALALSVATCVLVDYELYTREWFLNHVGFGTQEGQIVRKLKHSERLAAAADVIAFGSSFIRSSVSSEPFLAHGLLPFNFAVSGGGPVYSYYALAHIAPVARRPD
jgi:hypothetical protein